MPSPRHEGATYALHDQPEVALRLLASTGATLPAHDTLQVDSANLPDLVPTDFKADAVLTLLSRGLPVLSVVVEIQLRYDKDKPWVWPAYLANLRARRRCDVLLLVICLGARTAERCALPIRVGQPGWILTPTVLGPSDIPRVTDPDQAKALPGLTVLSALAHPTDKDVLTVLPVALSPLLPGVFRHYNQLVTAALPAASRRFLEDLVAKTPMYETEFLRKSYQAGVAEGRAEGLAEAVLDILATRKVRLSEEVRRRVADCHDGDQLRSWLHRALRVTRAEDLFVPDPS